VDGTLRAGTVRHPDPLSAPRGFAACAGAVQIYYRWESSLGGRPLLGTEGLRVWVFNSGYDLREVVFDVRGEGREGAEVFAHRYELAELPRGRPVPLEIPSYELEQPLARLWVRFVGAEFAEPASSSDETGT